MTVLFYIAAAVAIVATAAWSITRRKPSTRCSTWSCRCSPWRVVFYTLGAPFVAALEVIVYAGAIMVLFLVRRHAAQPERAPSAQECLVHARRWAGPAILGAILLAEMIYALTRRTQPRPAPRSSPGGGEALYGPYLLGVELASMLLLAALDRRAPPGARARRRGVEQARRMVERRSLPSATGRRREGGRLMASVPIDHGLVLAAILFVLGLVGRAGAPQPASSSSLSIEIMLNAAGLAFVVAGARWGQADGQVMFLFILAMAAAEVSVGLALVLRFHQPLKTLDTDERRAR